MWSLFHVTIICFILPVHGYSNNTSHSDRIVGISLVPESVDSNATNTNATAIAYTSKRKVLILNSHRVDALRVSIRGRGPKKLKVKKVESLLYEEYDDDGKVINTHPMYSLEDVVEFFKVYLDTRICEVACEG